MKPTYSICMCNYNMADTIERSLRSLLEQLDDRFEVVVVDDGSSDGSVSIVEDLAKLYPNLRLVPLKRDSKRKLGFTRNISIKEAKGGYVLLHLDCDDVFDSYLLDFVQIFHSIENCIGYNILLSGQHINMANRDFLLRHGPYLNLYRGEDRNLWSRMAIINAYIPLVHKDFITRLPKDAHMRFIKTVKDTFDHMRYDYRTGISFRKYIKYVWDDRHKFSLKLQIFRFVMLLPSRLMSFFDKPIPQGDMINTPELFALYRDNVKGTYEEIMIRNNCDIDCSFLSEEAKNIFYVRGEC